MSGRVPLARLEEIIDHSGAAPRIEMMLPSSVRHRQLTARTLLQGMLLVLADRRPAYLTEVRAALTSLPRADQSRLDVTANRETGPHQLTCRQAEHTCRLVARALGKDSPDGAPSDDLQAVCDQLLEASIPEQHNQTSGSLAADWTDAETWSRPPRHGSTECADPEAARGHRNTNLPGPEGEMFFGYFLPAAVMAADENGPAVPEPARRMTVCSCRLDPARALVRVLTALPSQGTPLGDVISDSGYAHRDARARALPLRRAGARLAQDLHPHDRGPRGTHHGAIIANGSLYCPQTPRTLLELTPLPPGAAPGDIAGHDQQAAGLTRHKLGRLTADDTDGYHRVICPAAMSKTRCPLRPQSMTLSRDRPEILTPPQHPRPAAPSRPSPSRPRSQPRPARNTTTPQRNGGDPTIGAPAQNAASPPSRTPPPPASPAAGAARPRSPRSRSGPPARWPSPTSASPPPSTPGKKTTPAAAPPASRPAPQNGGGPPPPSSQPRHNSPRHAAPRHPAGP